MYKMRLRKVLTHKFFALIAFIAILIILSLHYLEHERSDRYMEQLAEPLGNQELPTKHNELLNLTDFAYILPNALCHKFGKELLALLIVTSYVGHDELRSAHRKAISQSKLAELGMQRLFLLAAIPAQERFVTQKQLKNEEERFGDILQGNFQEAYRNLSYKHIMGLGWAAVNCTNAKFVIKLDDDIVYDIFQLRRYLESLEMQYRKQNLLPASSLLAGYVLEEMQPIRNVASKWYVSQQDYDLVTYPAYLSGWLYITTPSTARRLVREAWRAPIFWIDDTWITGVLRARLNISMLRLNSWYSANSQFLDCCVRDLKQYNYECEFFVGPNGGNAKLLVEFLHNVEKCYYDECFKRPVEKSIRHTCVAEAKHILQGHGHVMVRPIKLR